MGKHFSARPQEEMVRFWLVSACGVSDSDGRLGAQGGCGDNNVTWGQGESVTTATDPT
jgi:hypothetical protein